MYNEVQFSSQQKKELNQMYPIIIDFYRRITFKRYIHIFNLNKKKKKIEHWFTTPIIVIIIIFFYFDQRPIAVLQSIIFLFLFGRRQSSI